MVERNISRAPSEMKPIDDREESDFANRLIQSPDELSNTSVPKFGPVPDHVVGPKKWEGSPIPSFQKHPKYEKSNPFPTLKIPATFYRLNT